MAKVTPINKSPRLLDLTDELRSLMAAMAEHAEQNDGDVSEFPLEQIDKLEGDIKAKVLKCAMMIKEEVALAKSIEDLEKSLKARRSAHANHAAKFKEYIASCLPENAKYEDDLSSVSWKRNPVSVKVTVDPKILPERYVRRAAPEANLEALKADAVPYEVEFQDADGKPVLDQDGKPALRTEVQVRWPMPTGEKKMIPGPDDEPMEVDVTEDKVIARLVQGRSLMIR